MFFCRHVFRSAALRNKSAFFVSHQLNVARRALASASASKPFLLTDIGEGIVEVEVIKFFVKEGDAVSQFQPLVEVQSDKATVEISSRYDGIVDALSYKPGDIATVGSPLCYIRTPTADGEHPVESSSDVRKETAQQAELKKSSQTQGRTENLHTTSETNGSALATPATRGLARNLGINIDTIAGSGINGRVLDKDVLKHMQEHGGQPASEIPERLPAQDLKSKDYEVEDDVEPIRGLRRGMLKSMTASLDIPQLGLSDDVSMERAIALRKHVVSQLGTGSKLRFTIMPIFIKATSMALSEFPLLNAKLDSENSNVIYQRSHNISVAMNTKDGLIVPNIKSVEQMSMLEIAEELMRLGGLRNSGKFGTRDLEGGTFTLSNIGSIGGRVAKPVVFSPQSCIGALGAVQKRAVVDETSGEVVARDTVSVWWAADHRIIDGATMAAFNGKWRAFMENPEGMLAHLK